MGIKFRLEQLSTMKSLNPSKRGIRELTRIQLNTKKSWNTWIRKMIVNNSTIEHNWRLETTMLGLLISDNFINNLNLHYYNSLINRQCKTLLWHKKDKNPSPWDNGKNVRGEKLTCWEFYEKATNDLLPWTERPSHAHGYNHRVFTISISTDYYLEVIMVQAE